MGRKGAETALLLQVVHGNVPHHDRPGYAPTAARPVGLLDQAPDDLTLGTLVEYHTAYEGAFLRRDLRVLMPRGNNRLRDGSELGNAQVFAPDSLLVERERTIGVRVKAETRRVGWRRLHLPIVTYRVRGTDTRLVVITGHAIRRQLDPAGNARVLRTVDRAGRKIHRRTGRPVLLGMDANRHDAARYLRERGWEIGVRHGIDLVAGLGVEFRRGRVVEARTAAGKWSDHPLLVVTVQLKEKP